MATETPTTELDNNVARIAVLGLFSPGEQTKTDKIHRPGTFLSVDYKKESDGLFAITVPMPDGRNESHKQTDVTLDSKTGFKAIASEQRNFDGGTYLGPDGNPQALIVFPGNTATNQDINTSTKIVEGQNVDYIFKATDKFVEKWAANAQQRARDNHQPLPDVVIGTHSIGAFSGQRAALKLKELGFNVTQVIEIEPVGAGAALEALSREEAKKYFHTETPLPAQVTLMADIVSQNVVSLRAPDTVFQGPGGLFTHANAMVGETYRYDTAGGAAHLMTDHQLSSLANVMLAHGASALHRTPFDDTPAVKIVHDTPLAVERQMQADAMNTAYVPFSHAIRKGSHDAQGIDIHNPAGGGEPYPKPDIHIVQQKTPFERLTPEQQKDVAFAAAKKVTELQQKYDVQDSSHKDVYTQTAHTNPARALMETEQLLAQNATSETLAQMHKSRVEAESPSSPIHIDIATTQAPRVRSH